MPGAQPDILAKHRRTVDHAVGLGQHKNHPAGRQRLIIQAHAAQMPLAYLLLELELIGQPQPPVLPHIVRGDPDIPVILLWNFDHALFLPSV